MQCICKDDARMHSKTVQIFLLKRHAYLFQLIGKVVEEIWITKYLYYICKASFHLEVILSFFATRSDAWQALDNICRMRLKGVERMLTGLSVSGILWNERDHNVLFYARVLLGHRMEMNVALFFGQQYFEIGGFRWDGVSCQMGKFGSVRLVVTDISQILRAIVLLLNTISKAIHA